MVPRRAVVFFPPAEAVAELEAIRRRWDPVMAARVAAHLTVVHDVTDHERADELVACTAAAAPPLTVTLTETARWGTSTRGIYLAVDDHRSGVAAVHDSLAGIERPGWLRFGYRPHVTVVHARYVAAETADAAWSELSGWAPHQQVRIDRLAVIEMGEHGWTTVAEHPLTGAVSSLPVRPVP